MSWSRRIIVSASPRVTQLAAAVNRVHVLTATSVAVHPKYLIRMSVVTMPKMALRILAGSSATGSLVTRG